jgi:hypothetical protein
MDSHVTVSYLRASRAHQKYVLFLISVTDWVKFNDIVRLEVLGKMEIASVNSMNKFVKNCILI